MDIDGIVTKMLWFILGSQVTSVFVRIDHPECFADGSVWFPVIGLVLTVTIMLLWRTLRTLINEN